MNPLKKLAGQTAIYGLSSIVARIINFFFVPLYSRVLSTGNYGLSTEILAYVAMLQVVFTFGMETGYFRFANKHKNEAASIFSTALIWIGGSSLLFFIVVALLAGPIGMATGHPTQYLLFAALALAIDCFTAILFAELRFREKAWTFALFRSIKIISEIGFNLILFFIMPSYFAGHPHAWILHFIPPKPDYGYILLAILLSCVVSLLLFVPKLMRTHLKFSPPLFRQLFIYSMPLMIAGLPGVANDVISRVFFRFLAPATMPWQSQLGIFGANVKLAVFMVLFVQMFRYAAEPFFFATESRPDMRKIYADVMKYFVAFCMCIFLGIALFPQLFSLLLGKEFRSGIGVLPIMLVANVLLGMVFNLSMWYKLSDMTRYALYITLLGLGVNVLLNIAFMPLYGAMAAAWSYLASYFSMVVASYFFGQKFYPIPYDVRTICLYFGMGILIYFICIQLQHYFLLLGLALSVPAIALYVLMVLRVENVPLARIKQLVKW